MKCAFPVPATILFPFERECEFVLYYGLFVFRRVRMFIKAAVIVENWSPYARFAVVAVLSHGIINLLSPVKNRISQGKKLQNYRC